MCIEILFDGVVDTCIVHDDFLRVFLPVFHRDTGPAYINIVGSLCYCELGKQNYQGKRYTGWYPAEILLFLAPSDTDIRETAE